MQAGANTTLELRTHMMAHTPDFQSLRYVPTFVSDHPHLHIILEDRLSRAIDARRFGQGSQAKRATWHTKLEKARGRT